MKGTLPFVVEECFAENTTQKRETDTWKIYIKYPKQRVLDHCPYEYAKKLSNFSFRRTGKTAAALMSFCSFLCV